MTSASRHAPAPGVLRLVAIVLALAGGVLAQGETTGDERTAFALEGPPPPASLHHDLETPRAALETFVRACRDRDFERAAGVLALGHLSEEDVARAPRIARRLHFVIRRRVWFDWDEIPDRPDAMIDDPASTSPLAGKARRSVLLADIEADGFAVPIRLDRYALEGGEPVWLFSTRTVERVDDLYAEHGRSFLARDMPEWARSELVAGIDVWEALVLLAALLLGAGAGWLAPRVVTRVLVVTGRHHAIVALLRRTRAPVAAVAAALTVSLVYSTLLSLTGPVARVLDAAFMILVVIALAWLVIVVIDFLTDRVTRRMVSDVRGGGSAREQRLLTQMSVARRVLLLVVVLAAIGIIVGRLELFSGLGVSLLASAGVASLVIGIAAHEVLGNVLAGIQIAIAQPVRIGDVVSFEGNWGRVESITYTFLTIRTWDERRVVVPLRYLIDKPIENWTLEDEHLIKPLFLRLDWRADVEAVRARFCEMAREDEAWDGSREPEMILFDSDEEGIKLRGLCSARNASEAWDLHCRLREGMIAWLRDREGGAWLPRRRVVVDGAPPVAPRPGPPSAEDGGESG